ncbi:MAG: hypothetical protein ACYS8W_20630 [Planctomycetota bacterium]|jgi:hypothetical protein
MSRMQCEECGCHAMAQREISGHVFIECGVCGAQIGNDDLLDEMDFQSWAEYNGIEREVRELVNVLNSIEGFSTFSSCGGHPGEGLPPYVYFKASVRAQRFVARFVELLEMFARETSCRWIIEVTVRKGLSFWLRPLFPVITRRLDDKEVTAAQRDLDLIAGALRKHAQLSWWYKKD